jgi:hypothetical protein
MEALCDYGYATPVFYDVTNSVSYSAKYEAYATNANNVAYYRQYYISQNVTNKDYFLGGKVPTCVAFVPKIKIVPDYKTKVTMGGGLTSQEVGFVRSISGLSQTECKVLAGLLVRSLGGLNGGGEQYALGSVHLSLGDNKVLAEIVEDLLSSYSARVSEQELDEVFWKYMGNSDDVNFILKNYDSLVKDVTSAGSL